MSNRERRKFTKEFKLEAVKLLKSGNKPPADLARELGIKRTLLYRWLDEIDAVGTEAAFPGIGKRDKKSESGRVAELERENARLKEELEILKKAAIYFAKDHA